jgi:hypothetical protein
MQLAGHCQQPPVFKLIEYPGLQVMHLVSSHKAQAVFWQVV